MKCDNKGRGQFAIDTWQDLKKAGGLRYSPDTIKQILEEESDCRMLTRQEVIQKISSYFETCLTTSVDDETQEINYVWKRNPTKSGLALALGISPQVLSDYVRGSYSETGKYRIPSYPTSKQRVATEDFDLIRKAFLVIEDFYEQKLGDNRNNAGTIFWLNNRENSRWSNEQEFKFSANEQQASEVVLTAAELPKLSDLNINGLPILKIDEETEDDI